MIDLTQNEYDKELFITDVLLGKENDKYLVKYADGSERIENFSVHNFNATLLRMEKQYLQYRDEYYKKLCVERLGLTLKSIGNLIIDITSVYLTMNSDMGKSLRITILTLLCLFTILYQNYLSIKIKENNKKVNVILLADELLKRKDEFTVLVIDPIDNELKPWYLINMANIETVKNKLEFNLISSKLTPEEKVKQGAAFSKKFKNDRKRRMGD